MTSPHGGKQYQNEVGAPGGPHGPIITSSFDFTAEALGQLTFLIGRDIRITRSQVNGLTILTGSKTWDPASVADGAQTNTTVTVTGAQLGDVVSVSFSLAVTAGAFMVGHVTAADTVTVTLFNKTGGALDLASGTLKAVITRIS